MDEKKKKQTAMYVTVLVVVIIIIGLIVFLAKRNNDNTKLEITGGEESTSTNSIEDKKTEITDVEYEAIVYVGTKGNFEEYYLTVDQTQQSKEIIKELIAEIGKHVNYDIEITSITHGNKTLSIKLAESFKPDEETANKIYDSIYQTCYKAYGITSDYFDLANGEQVKRSIND